MSDLMKGTRAWSRTHEGKKLIRYTLGSVVTTGVSFATIAILYGFRIVPGVLAATLTGNTVAMIPGYYLNRTWAWGKRGRSHLRKEVLPYWGMAIAGIAFSQLGALWAKHEIHTHQWAHLWNTALVLSFNLVSFAVFWILKMLVFNRIFHVNKLHDVDERLTVEERAVAPSATGHD